MATNMVPGRVVESARQFAPDIVSVNDLELAGELGIARDVGFHAIYGFRQAGALRETEFVREAPDGCIAQIFSRQDFESDAVDLRASDNLATGVPTLDLHEMLDHARAYAVRDVQHDGRKFIG